MELRKQSDTSPTKINRTYIITTVAIYLGNIAYGCSTGAFGPTTVYFANKYNTTIEDMAISSTISVASYVTGATLTSFIYNFVNRQVGVAVSMYGVAISLSLITFCPTLLSMYILSAIMGTFMGSYDASQIVWVMEMWQEKSGPFIQAQGLFVSIGGLLPGILMAPFLKQTDETGSDTMWIPFMSVGALAFLAATFQILLFIFKRYVAPPPRKLQEYENEKKSEVAESGKNISITRRLKLLKIGLVTFCAIFVAFDQGMEVSTLIYMSAFGQYSVHALTQAQASLLYSALMASYTVGRVSGIYAILKIRPQLILLFNAIVIVAANSFLILTGAGLWAIWVGTVLLGLGYSTIQASFFAFVQRHLLVTNAIGSLLQVCGVAVASVFPFLIAKRIETNALILPYVIFNNIGVLIIVFIVILKIVSMKKTGQL